MTCLLIVLFSILLFLIYETKRLEKEIEVMNRRKKRRTKMTKSFIVPFTRNWRDALRVGYVIGEFGYARSLKLEIIGHVNVSAGRSCMIVTLSGLPDELEKEFIKVVGKPPHRICFNRMRKLSKSELKRLTAGTNTCFEELNSDLTSWCGGREYRGSSN